MGSSAAAIEKEQRSVVDLIKQVFSPYFHNHVPFLI
jgi:hypothetical protein